MVELVNFPTDIHDAVLNEMLATSRRTDPGLPDDRRAADSKRIFDVVLKGAREFREDQAILSDRRQGSRHQVERALATMTTIDEDLRRDVLADVDKRDNALADRLRNLRRAGLETQFLLLPGVSKTTRDRAINWIIENW